MVERKKKENLGDLDEREWKGQNLGNLVTSFIMVSK